LDLSAQTEILKNKQLPILMEKLPNYLLNVIQLTINNKPETPYDLKFVDMMSIANFTRQYSNFFALEMRNHRLDNYNVTELASFAAQMNSNLKILILDNNHLGLANTADFFINLPPDLVLLSLRSNKFTDTTGLVFASSFDHFSKIEGLDFSYNRNLTDRSIVPIVQQWHQHPFLDAWGFTGTGIGDFTAAKLAQQISLISAQNLVVGMEQCNYLTDQGGVILAESILTNHSIKGFFATDNPGFGKATLEAFTDFIPKANKLLLFGVNANIAKPGLIADYLFSLQNRTELEGLDLSGMPLTSPGALAELSALISALPNLTTLFLDNTGLSDNNFNSLLPALNRSNIEHLSLNGNFLISDNSLKSLVNYVPRNLTVLEIVGLGISARSGESLGKLLQITPLQTIDVSYNKLGSDFLERFTGYLPGSYLIRLNLANCEISDDGALHLAEVLSSYQIPDDWLGSLDTSTIHSLGKNNPATNLTWLSLAHNNLTDIAARRLCQVLPGTDISVNNLHIDNNAAITEDLLINCGELGLSSSGSRLNPSGPYVWLWRQLPTLRRSSPVSFAADKPPLHEFSTVYFASNQLMWATVRAASLTGISPGAAYLLRQLGFSQNTAEICGIYLQQCVAFGLAIWSSPASALTTLMTTVLFYQLAPNAQMARFLQIMLTVCLLSFQNLSAPSQLEMTALQFIISMLGSLAGHELAELGMNKHNFWNSKVVKLKTKEEVSLLSEESSVAKISLLK
jgi:hypothetical protein